MDGPLHNISPRKDILYIGKPIQSLFKGRNAGFDASTKIKLVRHSSTHEVFGQPFEGTVSDLYQDRELFLKYQRHQRTANFDDVEYIVSFISLAEGEALFVGVFKNNGRTDEPDDDPLTSYYDFEEVTDFEVFKEKVVIEWSNPRGWHQWYRHKMYILDIEPLDDTQSPTNTHNEAHPQNQPSTDNRIRHTEASAAEMEARHQKMQEGIRKCLEEDGYTDITLEENHVDLQAMKYGYIYYFEVKTYDTARACIREALGQILEYNHFPNVHRANRMYIVGPVKATEGELQYIKYLRQNYHMNINYLWYSEEEGRFSPNSL